MGDLAAGVRGLRGLVRAPACAPDGTAPRERNGATLVLGRARSRGGRAGPARAHRRRAHLDPLVPGASTGGLAAAVPFAAFRLRRMERAGSRRAGVAGAALATASEHRVRTARGRTGVRLGGDAPARGSVAHGGSTLDAGVADSLLAAGERGPRLGSRARFARAGAAAMKVTGTVEFVDLEGGVWRLNGDDGKRY